MIAKIGKGANIYGAVSYNQLKVDKENGKVLLLNKIPETQNGLYTTAQVCRYFEPYLLANNKTEKPVRHISLNPDPSDKVSDERFMQMAEQYMREMGYGKQPYVVYKHTDIERTHIHIVTTCVQLDGSKIPDSYDHHRSMAICRELEQQYDLATATEKKHGQDSAFFKPVDYMKGDVKSQLAAVIRYLPKYYQFPTFGTYNALLSLFNITCEQVNGERDGKPKKGLVYFALNASGDKAGHPFKASLFGRHAGLEFLESHFEKSKLGLSTSPAKPIIKNTIEAAMHMAAGEVDFKKQLLEQGMNVVVRRNDDGRVYGVTFVDHTSRSVWNGSQLGKNLSANVFNDWWNNGKSPVAVSNEGSNVTAQHKPGGELAEPFRFLEPVPHSEQQQDSFADAVASLLPTAQGEDYEERAFENRMKRRKKKNNNL
jgi:hypothetical protein